MSDDQGQQNRWPQALVQSRKDLAAQNFEAVRVAVQAMRRQGLVATDITVQAVAHESGVSGATIYRRDDLFELVHRANPGLHRRQAEQVFRIDLTQLQAQLAAAEQETSYHKKEAGAVKIGAEGLKQEISQLRKRNVDLQREIARLKTGGKTYR